MSDVDRYSDRISALQPVSGERISITGDEQEWYRGWIIAFRLWISETMGFFVFPDV